MTVFSHVAPEFTTLNLPKPVFIVLFTGWLSLAGCYGLVQLARGMQPWLSWLGLTLCVSGPLLFLARGRLFQALQTRRTAFGYSIVCGLGLAMTLAVSYRYGAAAGDTHVWAGVTLLAWLVYLRWFSGVSER
jgi:multidrug transporter EmrE-like cation transporter